MRDNNNKNDISENKTKFFTRGGQITFHNWRMLFQINGEVLKLYLLSLIFLTSVFSYFVTPKEVLWATYYYYYSKIEILFYKIHIPMKPFLVSYHGKRYIENGISFLSQWQFVSEYRQIYGYILIGFLIAFAFSIGISLVFIKWLTKKGKAQAATTFLRGIKLDDSKSVIKSIYKNYDASDLLIDQFPLIKNSEVQHMLIHGTTGTGKGQLLQKLLDGIRKRGDRVILYDKGCSFVPTYYREGKDVLLNPFDERCANWDIWTEAKTEPDFENMAESLIPLQNENDPFWINSARTIFASASYKMKDDPEKSTDRLLSLLMTASLTELEQYLSGTQAATLASDKIEKTAISIRSVLSTYLKSLRFLKGIGSDNSKKFSIRDWINSNNDDQWLFISSNGEQHASLRSLISMWLSQASLSLLSLLENRDRRIWLIIDELPSLHRLPQLPETIAEVRKFGGCFVLGMQSFAQLEKCYGRHAAREIFDLLNTRFFFRSPSADMAKLVSNELGSQEVEDMREQYSYGANRIRDGISIGRQRVTQTIVTYSELMDLPDLTCYLRLPASYPIVKLNLAFEKRDDIAPHFIERTIFETNLNFKPSQTGEDSDEFHLLSQTKKKSKQKTTSSDDMKQNDWKSALPDIDTISHKKTIDRAIMEL
ncbi:MAG: type IV conjugative transfer system coupling protein TraD [Gammaproteobacteria bacterium RIFCSPHIGHO2_02_FULL_39_13]|nr:MAG: type IV conjugative transfer system coupling protein TraD [Gammaproteobacteria bacterium RIFCSPHIGHO2_02_FULL_39_13]